MMITLNIPILPTAGLLSGAGGTVFTRKGVADFAGCMRNGQVTAKVRLSGEVVFQFEERRCFLIVLPC
jgi:hypothetical protein